MGKCTFCGQKAGFLKTMHKECQTKYQDGKSQIIDKICNAIVDSLDFMKLDNDVKVISKDCFIKQEEINNLYSEGFDAAVNKFIKDGLIPAEDESKINEFIKYFNFGQDVLNKSGSLEKCLNHPF